jgi:hypothetical protein
MYNIDIYHFTHQELESQIIILIVYFHVRRA